MDSSGISNGAMPVVVSVLIALGVVVIIILIIAITWLYCRIFAKTGYGWALGLLMLVPIVNIIMLCVLAMGDWPVLNELRRLKQQSQASVGQRSPQRAEDRTQSEPDEPTKED